MNSNKELTSGYKYFCLAKGNQHIASEFAILKLQELIRKFQVKNVLEIGLGIGSIAGTLLGLNKNLDYSGTEANDFCLKALPENLKEDYRRLQIYSDLTKISSRIPIFDFSRILFRKPPQCLFYSRINENDLDPSLPFIPRKWTIALIFT